MESSNKIEVWILEKHSNPITRERIENLDVMEPNVKLKEEIEEYLANNQQMESISEIVNNMRP